MSVNKATLIDRLGRDPEVRYMANGDAVANFFITTEEQWKDRDGNRQARTEWHSIILYRKLGEIAGRYLCKGGLVYIEGRIQSRKCTSKDGIERTVYEIIGNKMKMLGGKPDNQAQPQTVQARPQASSQNGLAEPGGHRHAPLVDDIDDDIPY